MTLLFKCWIRDIVFRGKQTTLVTLMLNSWGSGWLRELHPPPPPKKIKTLKGSSLLERYFLNSGKKHKWNKSKKIFHCPGLLVVQLKTKNKKLAAAVYLFKVQNLEAFEKRAFARNGENVLFLPDLKPGAPFSSLLINILVAFFSPKNVCIKNLLRQIFFLLNDFLNRTWELICCLSVTCYRDIFKPNFFLKLSNHPLLALNCTALDPSPFFCFKLSDNDFSLLKSS